MDESLEQELRGESRVQSGESRAKPFMDESLEQELRERASFACEYCKLPDSLHPGPFEVEHIPSR